MREREVISNTSPLLYLHQLRQLKFQRILVTEWKKQAANPAPAADG
jgi:hypothetical protein